MMKFTTQRAKSYVGKRVIVSLRHIDAHGVETFSGLWGIIDSVHEGGLLLRVEGGVDDEEWMMPPDLGALRPAQHEAYEFDGLDSPVVNVDYEAYYSVAESHDAFKRNGLTRPTND